jgi:Uma2 family endonuclease
MLLIPISGCLAQKSCPVQNTLPNWLLAVLEEIWGDRQDWFFGVDMGIYTREAQRRRTPFVIPDGFLSLGVPRHKRDSRGRLSYVLKEEDDVVPILAVEMVSQTYGQEYHDKLAKYEHQYYDLQPGLSSAPPAPAL